MNCRELQSSFEERGWREALVQADKDISEHLRRCAACSCWLESRRRVWLNLDLLRQSVPSVPASLDTNVLAAYREWTGERDLDSRTGRKWLMAPALRFGLAASAAIFVAVLIVALRKPPVSVKSQWPGKVPSAPAQRPDPDIAARVPKKPVLAAKNRVSNPRVRMQEQTVIKNAGRPEIRVPDGFRSLMYCDELICDGGMELVRVQLSPGAGGLVAAATSGGRVVSAEVLVGADGIARGIRIEP
jgi:hypothetical protein